jgi:hypothetical protein
MIGQFDWISRRTRVPVKANSFAPVIKEIQQIHRFQHLKSNSSLMANLARYLVTATSLAEILPEMALPH